MRRSSDMRGTGRMRASGMRRMNAALLLGIIRERGLVSRAELSRVSGLTKPTVSSQVADLIRRGVVYEDSAGEPAARGGKPPQLLRFNADWGRLAAVEIGSAMIRVWLADLNGCKLDEAQTETKACRGAAAVLESAGESVRTLLSRGRARSPRLLALGVAAPGRVDAGSGVVLEAGNVFHWRDVAVRETFERAFRVPVVVENDVNLAALGEMHSGLAKGVRNFILIRLGTGVGAGLVLGGRLYQGTHWAAGEIGHMIFDRASAAEPSDRGHLEQAVGSDRVRERVRMAQADLPGALREAVSCRDPLAAQVVEDVAVQLGLAVADMAAVMDPELIILSGEMSDLVMDRVRSTVDRVIPWPVRIERSALGEDAALVGAAGSAGKLAHDMACGRDRGDIRPHRLARRGTA